MGIENKKKYNLY